MSVELSNLLFEIDITEDYYDEYGNKCNKHNYSHIKKYMLTIHYMLNNEYKNKLKNYIEHNKLKDILKNIYCYITLHDANKHRENDILISSFNLNGEMFYCCLIISHEGECDTCDLILNEIDERYKLYIAKSMVELINYSLTEKNIQSLIDLIKRRS